MKEQKIKTILIILGIGYVTAEFFQVQQVTDRVVVSSPYFVWKPNLEPEVLAFAGDAGNGTELCILDYDYQTLCYDISFGQYSSNPHSLSVFRGDLYFIATQFGAK